MSKILGETLSLAQAGNYRFMNTGLHILQLEDDKLDALLIQHLLTQEGVEADYEVVEDREAYLKKLQSQTFDCILADYTLPSFDAMSALALARQHQPDTPFIIVSGTIGEEFAIESIKAGATDYVLKNKLKRLVPALSRALQEAETHKQRIESESRYESVINAVAEGILLINESGIIMASNPRAEEILGLERHHLSGLAVNHSQACTIDEQGEAFPELAHPVLLSLHSGKKCSNVIMGIDKPGREVRWISVNTVPIVHPGAQKPHAVVASFSDITEQKKKEAQIRKLNEALNQEKERRLKELKSRFVSIASHQFRTPLAVVQSNIELLKLLFQQQQHEQIKAPFEKIYHRIQEEINRLTEMIDDVLVLEKLDAGKERFQPQKVDVIAFCRQLAADFSLLRTHERKLDFEYQGVPRPVALDTKLISHVLLNLISNAFKYSEGRGNPLLRLVFEEEQLKFEVIDDGIGIPAADQSKLFESFYRASNALDFPGTGLGLVIAREFVALHQGHLHVKSQEGKGSVFTITIPQIPTDG